MNQRPLFRLVLSALFAALIVVGSYIAIPFVPVPLVLANFFALLAGLLLGPVYGGLAVLLYLVLGALGLPVFAGGSGGFGHFASPTGGFLLGYLLEAVAAGFVARGMKQAKPGVARLCLASLAGLVVLYAIGLPWFQGGPLRQVHQPARRDGLHGALHGGRPGQGRRRGHPGPRHPPPAEMRLEIQGLGKRFEEGRWGLRGIDLTLERPGFTVVSGHNGSGKTLLARHILGLERPDEGRILLDGADLGRNLAEARRRIAFVFQEPEHQILGMTVDEDVAWTPARLGWPGPRIRAARERALRLVGLEARGAEPTAFLSGGEKRRLAIASVLAAEPELIILDEPFNDLDWPGVQALLAILLDLHRRGTALLVIHPRPGEVPGPRGPAGGAPGGDPGGGRAPCAGSGNASPNWGLRRPGPQCGTLEGMTWLS